MYFLSRSEQDENAGEARVKNRINLRLYFFLVRRNECSAAKSDEKDFRRMLHAVQFIAEWARGEGTEEAGFKLMEICARVCGRLRLMNESDAA